MSISITPAFNLKAVLKETGLAADTLRAWERRYGLPTPDRTPGGHRLYSQRDVETIKWLMAKQQDGLSISRAVDLWNEITASGQDPLPETVVETVQLSSANLDAVRQAWLEACLAFDENSAEQVLNQAFAAHPLETVCIEVIQRGLNDIGDLWYRAKASVQQEHFTSALAQRRLDALITATPPPTRPQTFLVGCTLGEQHAFTPLLLSLLLRRRGFKVVYLGANIPIERFDETVKSIKPHLVILSAQQLQAANGLRETAAFLKAKGTRVAYGGRVFNLIPEIRERIPGHFLGESVQAAIQSAQTLLNSDIPLGNIVPVSEKDINLGKAFVRNLPLIDTYALTQAIKAGIPIEYSIIAIQELGRDLASALSLGLIESMAIEIEWVKGALQEHLQNDEGIGRFLAAYAHAIDATMGKEGQPISNWLKARAN